MKTLLFSENHLRKWPYMLLGCTLFLLLASPGRTQDLVSGRYVGVQGRDVVLELTISAPPPATIIVKQKLPAGVTIIKSQPPIKSYNKKHRVAKWLLNNVRPGRLRISFTLSRVVRRDKITAEIRCIDPATGTMITMAIPAPAP